MENLVSRFSIRWTLALGFLTFACVAKSVQGAELLPIRAREFLQQHCADCHTGDDAEAEVVLDTTRPIDWQDSQSPEFWERVYDVLRQGDMPPKDADQPSVEDRQEMVKWLEQQLMEHAGVGGTVPRRLNRTEYENTIRALFHWPDFVVPDAFPADDLVDGFDNIGEGLILSPPLLDQYLQLATKVADEVLPPDNGPAVPRTLQYPIGIEGLGTSAGGEIVDGRFRLVSSQNMASCAGWPARFEAPQSGIYRLSVRATTFQTEEMFYEHRDEPFRLTVYARKKSEQVYDQFGKLRRLKTFDVLPGKTTQAFTAEIELQRGEIFGLRWENGPAYSDSPSRECSKEFYDDRLRRRPRHYAAMLQYRGGPRGATRAEIYDATTALIKSDELDLSDPRLAKLPEDYGGGLSDKPHAWIKKFVLEELHRFGPALDVTDVEVEGPFRLMDDDESRARKARSDKFIGTHDAETTDRKIVESVLRRFMTNAFRRPVREQQLSNSVSAVMQHFSQHPSARVEDGLHLAVRRVLVSPHFLYRALRGGRLDDFDLASRLSYFLTSGPPDKRLHELAASKQLSNPEILELETKRLLKDPRHDRFVRNFTSHWLGTRLLPDIMPDPRLLKFYDQHRRALIDETELFFAEIVRENHPIETFIDPDFSYRSAALNRIYGGDLQGISMQRVTLQRGGRHGGILGLGSVMMATANGVDTHPVLRGVWLLENVFGTPPPKPPANVPAIAPDTSGTSTMRAQLSAHRADASCARCHDHIDPLGMVLENFDPVGRWRDHYPIYTEPKDGAEKLKKEFYANVGDGIANGPPIDAVGEMPDGTRLNDVTDLKRYVVDHIDMFSRCVAEKLLTYATGRPLSFGDRRNVEQIAADVKQDGNGFRDLIVALVLSESFATK